MHAVTWKVSIGAQINTRVLTFFEFRNSGNELSGKTVRIFRYHNAFGITGGGGRSRSGRWSGVDASEAGKKREEGWSGLHFDDGWAGQRAFCFRREFFGRAEDFWNRRCWDDWVCAGGLMEIFIDLLSTYLLAVFFLEVASKSSSAKFLF